MWRKGNDGRLYDSVKAQTTDTQQKQQWLPCCEDKSEKVSKSSPKVQRTAVRIVVSLGGRDKRKDTVE